MRQLIILFFLLSGITASAQSYPFAKDFVPGNIVLKDSSRKAGQIKWFPQQTERLRFRENEKTETIKYSPEEIVGFEVDTLRFASLQDFDAYAASYALLGKTSHIKHTFGEIIDTGKFNIYFVLITDYNAVGGGNQVYPNFLFQHTQGNSSQLVAYPVAIRMKDKKYDKAKEDLYTLFRDYPDIVEKLKNYKQQDDFSAIVDMVKAVNHK